MTNAELILKLVEMLIKSEKKQNATKTNNQKSQAEDQYIANQKRDSKWFLLSLFFYYMTYAEFQSLFKLFIFYY